MRFKAIFVFLLSIIAFGAKAEHPSYGVIDPALLLDQSIHQSLDPILKRVAKNNHIEITVLITNENVPFNAANMVLAWEAKMVSSRLHQKRAFVVINTLQNQGAIVLGNCIEVDESLRYGINEIQQKILKPALLQKDINNVVWRATNALITALEEWPLASQKYFFNSLTRSTLMHWIKWLAEGSLLVAVVIGLHAIFHRHRKEHIPENTVFPQSDDLKQEMAYWRSHRHIDGLI